MVSPTASTRWSWITAAHSGIWMLGASWTLSQFFARTFENQILYNRDFNRVDDFWLYALGIAATVVGFSMLLRARTGMAAISFSVVVVAALLVGVTVGVVTFGHNEPRWPDMLWEGRSGGFYAIASCMSFILCAPTVERVTRNRLGRFGPIVSEFLLGVLAFAILIQCMKLTHPLYIAAKIGVPASELWVRYGFYGFAFVAGTITSKHGNDAVEAAVRPSERADPPTTKT